MRVALLGFLICASCVGAEADGSTPNGAADVPGPIVRGAVVPDAVLVPLLRLYYQRSNNAQDFSGCTASKIGPYALVTAAHCVAREDGLLRPSFVPSGVLRIGSRTSGRWWDGSDVGNSFRVVRSYVYPTWHSTEYFDDIAVVVVDRELFPGYPSGVLTVATNELAAVGRLVTIYGYGCTDPANPTLDSFLHNSLRWGQTYLTQMAGYEYHTQVDGTGADLCYGDSGGPMQPSIDAGRNGVFRIIALHAHIRRGDGGRGPYDAHSPVRDDTLDWLRGLNLRP